MKVKLLGFDERGKVRLSMKVVDQTTGEDLEAKQKAERRRKRRPAAQPNKLRDNREMKGRPQWPPFLFLLATLALDDDLPSASKSCGAATCAATPNRSCGRAPARRKRISLTRSSRPSASAATSGNKRHAVAVRHHLHHRGERGRAEAGGRIAPRCSRKTPAPDRAGSGPPPAGSAGADRHPSTLTRRARQRSVGRRHRQQKRVVEQPQRLDVGAFGRQRQHHDIELAARQLVEQQLGLRLAHLEPQLRIALSAARGSTRGRT